jgi:hypothetical protein
MQFGLLQDFELGVAGAKDLVLGGHRAADLAAEQEAGALGLDADAQAQRAQELASIELDEDIPTQAVKLEGAQAANAVTKAAGAVASGLKKPLIIGAIAVTVVLGVAVALAFSPAAKAVAKVA